MTTATSLSSVLEDYLEDALGEPRVAVRDLHKIGEGTETEIFAFDMRIRHQRTPLVLRQYVAGGGCLKAAWEAHALRCLARSAVPVPRVIAAEPTDKPLGHPFLIEERVEGQPMTQADLRMPLNQLPPLLHRFVDLFITLHTLDISSLGILAPGRFAYPRGPLDYAERKIEETRARVKEFELVEFHPVVKWLEGRLPRMVCRRPSLLHNDMQPGNILMRGNDVAAILDWSAAEIGDYHADLAASSLWGSTSRIPTIREAFLMAYGDRRPYSKDTLLSYEVLVACRRLMNLAIVLRYGEEPVGLRRDAVVPVAELTWRRTALFLQARTGIWLPFPD